MNYNNTLIRRQDRLLREEEATTLLRTGEYGVLSMTDETGKAYGIPVNYVWNEADSLYIHCAPQGRKLCCIAAHPEVSFCIVGRTHVVSNQFTTSYESIMLQCRATTGLPADERMHALQLLLQKYSPNDLTIGLKYAEKSFHRTEIIRLDIEEISGKCKRVQ